MRRLVVLVLVSVSWLALCGAMSGCGDDVHVKFSEDFHDGQGGSLRISTGDSSTRRAVVALMVAASGHAETAIRFRYDGTGIKDIQVDGRSLVGHDGGLYIIGACDERDNGDTNVSSVGAQGGVLISPAGTCPGAPFSIAVTPAGANAVVVELTIGPLPVQYGSLTVPLQLEMQPGDTFAFADDGEGYKVGCGPQEWRPGASGLFEDIPTPCTVSLHGTSGAVGAAYTNRPVAWASISREDGSTIRRTFLDLDYAGVEFIENQFLGVRTVEPRFHDLDRGRVLHARELIDVM